MRHNATVFSLPRRGIALGLAVLIAVGAVAALVLLRRDDPAPAAAPAAAAGSTTTVAEKGPDPTPTVEIRHVSPDPARVTVARERAISAFAKAKRLERQAHIETEPGEMPPASAGDNGTFDEPPANSRRIKTATMAGTDGLPPERSALMIGRMAIAPPDAPVEVERAISAANAIVGRPYVWGGGHGSWNDNGYDCSGAVSYALGGAGLLGAPVDSSALMHWGEPGPGKGITVNANAGHTYAVIAGLRWDTVGEQRGTGPKWHAEAPYPQGFVARHPPGL
jgi:cell wall-associated NlpC family hydrolase